ncbi:FTR1 family protein [Staphylococcus carnosus]|uniref:FTR1 family iron permease n=1 Tax=Staphylococcus carnosus (strain TM300) TaxID=396513 RepID=B9DJC0_STACT|nr:FTR1 family protein [Staphylococcus carnosus]QPT02890.1 FTR1 family protein [Staphylococcus carnosus]UQA67894.1 FTR1 family protein [Staphylococcus carnosus]UTB77285.1 hypothetical protein A2I62_01285 [Staphylococcus carnosus]UTB86829.1 hypothetical protein A2I63_01275 [Staphylococcus carnosus]UTB89179.1 hypothetical protein A2I64_01280 [Staphylococcus carnosus]
MRHYLVKIALCIALLSLLFPLKGLSVSEAEETSMSDAYIAISDAKETLNDKDKSEADKKAAVDKVKAEIDKLKIDNSKSGKKVKDEVKALDQTPSDKKKAADMSDLTKALIAYENAQASSNSGAEIKKLQDAIDGKGKAMKDAIKAKDQTQLKALNAQLNQIWTSNETVIRNYDADKYGQIEVALMQLRVAVEKEPLKTQKVETAWQTFKSGIDNVNKKQSSDEKGQYKATQLNDELDTAIQAIEDNDLDKADAALGKFIQIWPYVEGKIQTKNSSLYTTIEDKIPYYQSILDNSNKERVKDGLSDINSDIKDTIGKSGYNAIDVMVIFLREGLEVLLIVMALVAMTRQSKDKKGTTSVIGGALLGLVLSLALAFVFIQTLGNSGILREGMEAVLGIVAVILMIAVGIWMHNKSNAQRWNQMMQSMYDKATNNRSLVLLGLIGLISVMREGVEVILFYMGMIGEVSAKDFILGIGIALVILAIFAVLFRFIVHLIPIRYIFRVLSILIFVMAFKMLGVSIQKMQLLDTVSRHGIEHLPTLSWIGFYPTWETIVPQLIFVILIAVYTYYSNKRKQL